MRFTAFWRALLPAAALVAWVAAACERGRQDEGMDGAYEGRTEGTEQVGPPAMEPAGTMSDREIITELHKANTTDSALGRLAAQKGTHEDVRDFGERMAREHHGAQERVHEVAQRLALTPAAGRDAMDRQTEQLRDSLQRLPRGRAWDRSYIDHEVRAHEQALELLTRAENSTQRQEVRDLVNQLSPVIQEHLERARDIQRDLQQSGDTRQDTSRRQAAPRETTPG